jgi:hypothetical protein
LVAAPKAGAAVAATAREGVELWLSRSYMIGLNG